VRDDEPPAEDERDDVAGTLAVALLVMARDVDGVVVPRVRVTVGAVPDTVAVARDAVDDRVAADADGVCLDRLELAVVLALTVADAVADADGVCTDPLLLAVVLALTVADVVADADGVCTDPLLLGDSVSAVGVVVSDWRESDPLKDAVPVNVSRRLREGWPLRLALRECAQLRVGVKVAVKEPVAKSADGVWVAARVMVIVVVARSAKPMAWLPVT
jgi:hypothetical protein